MYSKRNHISVLLASFFLLSSFAFSQVSSGKVIYGVNADSFLERAKKMKSEKKVREIHYFESMTGEMKRIELTLNFNQNQSIFKKNDGLSVDNTEVSFSLANAFADRGSFYTDLAKKKQLLVREYSGELILVNDEIKKIDWKITSDKKVIGKFNCYKAISSIETSIGPLPLIAWYTPEIPLSFGPAGYGGTLPGLILELQTNELTYVFKEISLNPRKEFVIDWPESKNAITIDEYKNLNKKLVNSYRKN